MKIAIVGADGTNKAWTPERIEKAKLVIRAIFHGAKFFDHLPKNDFERYLYGFIQENIEVDRNIILISGHCPKGGVDIWAEEMADEFGIHKEIYPAETNQWRDKKVLLFGGGIIKYKGYRSRNIQIAEACGILYDIETKGSCEHCGGRGFTTNYGRRCRFCYGTGVYSGGTFTYRKALEFGKEAHQIIIDR
jgi:hypothetical protein